MGPHEGSPGGAGRLPTYAVLAGLLLTGGLVVAGDQPVPSGLSGGVALVPGPTAPGTGAVADAQKDAMAEAVRSHPGSAPRAEAVAGGSGGEEVARATLARAGEAEGRISYTATQFVSVRGPRRTETTLLDLVNTPGHGTTVRLHGDPPERARFLPHEEPEPSRPRDLQAVLLDDLHVLSVAGRGVSAGRDTTIIEAARPSGVLAGRFWIDDATGLLLRREVYAPDGDLARVSGFVDLAIGKQGRARAVPSPIPGENGEPVATAGYDALAADGWFCCPRRLDETLRLTEVRRSADDRTLQLVYSDGLTATTVFQQPADLNDGTAGGFTQRREGNGEVYVRYGLSSSASWSVDGMVYTVVSDTPYGLDRARAVFPRDRAPENAGQRLGRGMHKIMSWLNPFD